MGVKDCRKYCMPICNQVAIAPCTDPIQVRSVHLFANSRLRALEKRDQLLRVVWLLSTPENVIYSKVFGREFEQFRYRDGLLGLRLSILVVAVLNCDADRNCACGF